MPRPRAAFLIGLSLALLSFLGVADDPPAQSKPAEEPSLKEIFRDDFQADTRKNYVIKNDVDWQKGGLTLSEKSSIGTKIESGPWSEWQFDLEPPILRADGDQASTLLRLELEGATTAYVNWIWNRQNSRTTGQIRLLDTNPEDDKKLLVLGEFPIPMVDGPWKVGYRFGLLSVDKGVRSVAMGYMENGAAFPAGWTLSAERQSLRVQKVQIHASPRWPSFTPDETQALAQAAALNKSANSLFNMGKLAEAEPLFVQDREIRKRVLGKDHIANATCLNNLAVLYNAMGEYDKARPLLVEAAEIRRRTLGEWHPHYAVSLNNLALWHESKWELSQAVSLCKQACDIFKRAQGAENPDYATSLNNLAELYKSLGTYAQAEPLLVEARDIRKRVLGEKHRDYAASLNNLASLYMSMQAYPKAEPLFLEALEVFKQTLGEEHPDYATSLDSLATLYESMAQYEKAGPLFEHALDIRKRVLGEVHPAYATSLNNLASLYASMGRFAMAEPLFLQARDIRKQVFGEEHPVYASSLNNLADLYRSMGAYDRAERMFVQARDLRRKLLGENHPDYAVSLNNLAELYRLMGAYETAEPLCRQALEIHKRTLGAEHPTFASSLSNLAVLYDSMGLSSKAEPLYAQARDIRKRVLGEEHPSYAVSLNNLGFLYASRGEFLLAEPLYVQACDIYKRRLGEEHPEFATSLSNLAELYSLMGAYAKAEPLHVQAAEIRRRVLGAEHPDYALSLNNLARLYDSLEDYARAEPMYVKARDVRKQALGDQHPDYAQSLQNLAGVYVSLGAPAKAEPLYKEACDIQKRVWREEHSEYAASLNNLAMLYLSTGEFDKAEPLLIQSRDIFQRSADYRLAVSLNNLAGLYMSMGDANRAEPLFQTALMSTIRNAQDVMSGLSEVRSQEFVGQSVISLAALLSAGRQIDNYPNPTAYSAVWQVQGLVSRTLRERRHMVENDPNARILLAELRTSQQQLALWTLTTSAPGQLELRQKQIQKLDDEKDRLETDLARISATFKQATELEQRTPGDLMRVMPDGTAVVHLLKTQVWESPAVAKGRGVWTRHYEAFVLTKGVASNGSRQESMEYATAWIHLGPAQPIESALTNWRRQIQKPDGKEKAAAPLSLNAEMPPPPNFLRKEVWLKIEPHLAGCKSVIVIPDGELHFLPWGALPGNKPGTYLIEEYAIATAQDGRQLYQTLTAPAPAGEPSLLLVGGVDYDHGDARPTAPPPVIELTANEPSTGSRSTPPALSKRPSWPKLAGAAVEIDELTKLAGKRSSKSLRGSEAQENTLRQEMPKARFIHLATHGFFADESFRSAFQQDETGEQLFGGAKNFVTKKRAGVTYRNPLLLSGIVLAGANQPPQVDTLGLETGQDGILTAEEVVNLDLQNTELVVLSACETGLGRVGGGEGVFGLQRAFELAGARTTVASLWKVDDAATQALMTEFYRNLWEKKLPKLEALRQAQLTMLRRYEPTSKQLRGLNLDAKPLPKSTGTKSETLPPYYWAGFTISGDWR